MVFYFILVNYNNSDYSIDCIKSILRQGICAVKIYIVDNASVVEEKNKLFSWVTSEKLNQVVELLFLERNIGYFPAINRVYIDIFTLLKKNDLLFIGNNDLILKRDFIEKMITRTFSDDIFVISPDIVNRNNNHQNPAVRKKYSKLQLLYLDIYHCHYVFALLINLCSTIIKFRGSQKSKEGWKESGFISVGYGACYVLTHNYWENIKEIPHYLFLMNEENALSDVVFKNGGRIYYDKDLVVYHMEHSSLLKLPKYNKYRIEQESYRISKKYFCNADLYDKNIK